RVELLAAYVGGRVNDLALQVGIVHHVEVDNAECANTGGGQIKGERRAQASRADAEHAGRFQLQLTFHANLGHDEVARVAENLVVTQRDGFGFGVGNGGHKNLNSGVF